MIPWRVGRARTAGPLEWPASDARSLVLELAGDAPLVELVTVRQLRRKRIVRDGDTKVELTYAAPDAAPSTRTVLPLALYFWGGSWTLGAYCELREDYRNFRLDRIAQLALSDQTFELVSPVTLEEFVAAMQKR